MHKVQKELPCHFPQPSKLWLGIHRTGEKAVLRSQSRAARHFLLLFLPELRDWSRKQRVDDFKTSKILYDNMLRHFETFSSLFNFQEIHLSDFIFRATTSKKTFTKSKKVGEKT